MNIIKNSETLKNYQREYRINNREKINERERKRMVYDMNYRLILNT